ncbi:MAG: Rieske 2Fe-2S domain-containing protein [Planctomycetes bacterium]|nr:Rieske 2Fe-2S domain-containing protein [Planctomycetota bacterium]
MGEYRKVGTTSDVPPGQKKVFQVAGKDVAVFNAEGKFYALENTCPHAGGPLGEGMFSGTVITCPWHGFQFNVTTGGHVLGRGLKVSCFPIKVQGNDILIEAG